jgi:hypothetical protein
VTWRLAVCIDVLGDECDEAAPNRSKVSDGTIGDDQHASRTSDHNPYIIDRNGVGVVRARDITHDPANGMDCHVLAEQVRKLFEAQDIRRRYVIWNRRIASASSSPPWSWRPYTGSNPHDKHAHVSVTEDPDGYDSAAPWGIADEPKEDELTKTEHDWLHQINAYNTGVLNGINEAAENKPAPTGKITQSGDDAYREAGRREGHAAVKVLGG